MFEYDQAAGVLRGPGGVLNVRADDHATLKLAMLLEGECSGSTRARAAKLFGYSRASYYQAREAFLDKGAAGLVPHKRGPKGPSRRTPEVVLSVIRARFLDPTASPEVIASTLRQQKRPISDRSVARIIRDYGLQKKTPPTVPGRSRHGRHTAHQAAPQG